MKCRLLLFFAFATLACNAYKLAAYNVQPVNTPFSTNGVSRFHAYPFPLLGMLPSQNVHGSYQDRDGFFWFGTSDGVCRYDGYRLNVFRSGVANATKMTNNDVLCVIENDNYFVFGSRKGLNVLDKKTYQVFALPFSELTDDEVRTIQTDDKGNFWIGTKRRLVRLSADLKHCEQYDSRGVPVTSVNSVYKDGLGRIFVSYWSNGLYLFDAKTERFSKLPAIGQRDNPFCMMQIGRSKYLVTTWGEGCFLVSDMGNGRWQVSKANTLGVHPERLKDVYSLAWARGSNLIWMGTTQGLCATTVTHDGLIAQDVSEIDKVVGKGINKVNADRYGNIWVSGSYSGLFRISPFAYPWKSYSLDKVYAKFGVEAEVNCCHVDAHSYLWVGQSMLGLAAYSPQGQLLLYTDIPALRPYDKLKDISCIGSTPSAKAETWVAPRYEPKIYRITNENGHVALNGVINLGAVQGGNALVFAEDGLHNVWIPTDMGVLVLTNKGVLQNLNLNLRDVHSLAFTPDGKVWLATMGDGVKVYSYKMSNGKMVVGKQQDITPKNSPLTTTNMAGMCYDKARNKMWMITAEGLLTAYNLKSRQYETYVKELESYILSTVQGLMLDKNGCLWIPINNQILKFNPSEGCTNVYSADDGIGVKSFLRGSFAKGPAGNNLFFAGKGGVVRIQPDALGHHSQQQVKPLVADVRVGGKSLWMGGFDNSYSFDNMKQTIRLGADARDVEIDLSTCNFSHPNKVIFAYKLEGVDKDWNYTTPNKPSAYYTNLSKGHYKLLIRATGTNGEWGKQTVAYSLYRQPAFYETWWAYLIYAL